MIPPRQPRRAPALVPSVVALLVAGLGGCAHHPAQPYDPSADLASGAAFAYAASSIGDKPASCVTLRSLGAAIDAVGDGFRTHTLPPPVLDIMDCGITVAAAFIPDDADDIARAIAIGLRGLAGKIQDPCAREWLDNAIVWALGVVDASLVWAAAPGGPLVAPPAPPAPASCAP